MMTTADVERDVVKIRLRLDYGESGGKADYLAALEALDRLARLAQEAARTGASA